MVAGSLAYLVFIFVLVASAPSKKETKVEEDAILTTPQLIVKYGYPAEIHHVTTEDGYILEMHRIPYGKLSPPAPNKPAVLLQHGLDSSSADWVSMGVEKGFGYMLADLGYDVWMGNTRGNTYSRHHVTLDPDAEDNAFWNFSWHEVGLYDVTAHVDHILEVTGQESVIYVGHSQGTTQFYVSLSERPEYNAKIKAMFSFAPVAYMSHLVNPIFHWAVDTFGAARLEEILGIQEFGSHSDAIIDLGDTFCHDGAIFQGLCSNVLFLLCGFDSEQLNETMIPVIVGHTPAGASTKQMLHYAQLIENAKFQQYDYGVEGNIGHYGSESPPAYDVSKITTPVYLHYSLNDWLSAPEDVMHLHNELGNSAGMFEVPLAAFNHLDFVFATDVKPLLYDLVSSQMDAIVNSK